MHAFNADDDIDYEKRETCDRILNKLLRK